MKTTIEREVKSPYGAAEGTAMARVLSRTIDNLNLNLIKEDTRKIAENLLNEFRENIEVTYNPGYRRKMEKVMKELGIYHAYVSESKEFLKKDFEIGKKIKEREISPHKSFYDIDLNELEKTAQEIKQGYEEFK